MLRRLFGQPLHSNLDRTPQVLVPELDLSVNDLAVAYTGTVSDNTALAQEAAKATFIAAQQGLIGNGTISTFKVDTKAKTLTYTSTIYLNKE